MFEIGVPTLGLALLLLASAVASGPSGSHASPTLSEGLAATPLSSDELPVILEQTGEKKAPTNGGGWIKGDQCAHGRGGETFCAFSRPSFKDGEGLSIVTTEARLANLQTRPAFSGGEAADSTAPQTRYEAKEIPGKGVGLIATEPIYSGQLIMAHTPAVMVDGRVLNGGILRHEAAALIGQGVKALPETHRAGYLNLSTQDASRGFNDQVLKAFLTNAFQTQLQDGEETFHSIYIETARINHACRPNSAYHFDYKTLTHKVYAARDILVGEELTVTYIDPVSDRATRQRKLNREWGFKCRCSHCSAEPHVSAESDSRVAHLLQLIADLDDHTAKSGATPEEAELAVHLSKIDGMWARTYELHYRAALEYNGVGRSTEAMVHARSTLQQALTFRGSEHPVIKSMKLLVHDPEKHWSWKFRLRIAEKAAAEAKERDPGY